MSRIYGFRKFLASALVMLALGQGAAMAQVAWVNTFDEALKLAAKEKKSVILDISASW